MYLKNQKHTPPYILLPTMGSVTNEYTETHSKLDLLTFTYMLICNPVFLYCHFKHFKHTKPQRVSLGVANFIGCNRLYSSKVHIIHLAELLLTFVEELECLDVVLKPCFCLQSAHMKQIPKQSCV